jgi:hypothetical protein
VKKIFSLCLSRKQLGFNTLNSNLQNFSRKKEKPSDSTKIINYIYSLLVVSSSLFFALFCSREREREKRERERLLVFLCVFVFGALKSLSKERERDRLEIRFLRHSSAAGLGVSLLFYRKYFKGIKKE